METQRPSQIKSIGKKKSITKLLVQRRDSLKKIVKKAKEKKGQKRKNIDGEMSHIKAKWLLGLSVTMVNVLYEIFLIMYSTEMQEYELGNDFQAPRTAQGPDTRLCEGGARQL